MLRFTEVQRQLEAGENVILLANHQTEADPGVFALLLEASHPTLATEVIYVAGSVQHLCHLTILLPVSLPASQLYDQLLHKVVFLVRKSMSATAALPDARGWTSGKPILLRTFGVPSRIMA